MTALPLDAVADLQQRIAELERQLETAVEERDAAIERQTASALVNFRLKNELRAVTERQSASIEILNAIANTEGNADHALQRIAETTQHFFNSASVTIRIAHGDQWVQTVRVGSSSHLTGAQPTSDSITGGTNLPATIYRENRQIHIPDLDNVDSSMADWPVRTARAAGIRTVCGSPLRRGGRAIGALIVYRDRLAAFTDDDLALQQSFADQAVIAIENARLFNETQEALERQTATADILKVIASSPSDVQPVFDAIAEHSNRLMGGHSTSVFRFIDDSIELTAFTPVSPEADAVLKAAFPRPVASNSLFELTRSGDVVQTPDTDADQLWDPDIKALARARGFRSRLLVPLVGDKTTIGFISVTRRQAGQFADQDVALLKTFADQAVIAIQNARLFNETQEALERQTATADILKVIASSPSNVQPVFDAIAGSSKRLLGGFGTAAYRFIDGMVCLQAFTPTTPEADEVLKASFPAPAAGIPFIARLQQGETVEVPDAEISEDERTREIARARGWRGVIFTPLMNSGVAIGFISVTRVEPGAFPSHHVQLLQTFADQAVIAIENTRLFNETQQALERQTATADILKVIASSPSDVQPVFDAIAESARHVVGGLSSIVTRVVGDEVLLAALTAGDEMGMQTMRRMFPQPISSSRTQARVARTGQVVMYADTERDADDATRETARARGARSLLAVPMLRDGSAIGTISVTRAEPGGFDDNAVGLLKTFADQAVIAIENTRLFNETKEALERQTATADILKVIASSPSDVQPVFDAIAASANRLIGGFSTAVFRFVDGIAHLTAFTPTTPEADELLRSHFPRPVDGFEAADLARQGTPIVVPDTELATDSRVSEIGRARGFRSMLFVPLMKNAVPIGLISVTRVATGSFANHHVQLLQTFADQAVIAIENTRLFNETKEALERQTATADILKVIASSPSDVQPVFEAIVNSAARLFEPCTARITTLRDGMLHWHAANAGAALQPNVDLERAKANYPLPFDPDRAPSARAILERRIIEIPDTAAPGTPEFTRRAAAAGGFRSIAFVPLINRDNGIGTIIVTHAQPGFRLSEKQLSLAQTFADQAVIAIENARLFNETQEALERQTATADILKVIASSPSDVQPVFDAILARSLHLCEAAFGFLTTYDGERYAFGAQLGVPPALAEHFRTGMDEPRPGDAHWRLLEGEDLINGRDQKDEEAYRSGNPLRRAVVDLGGARSALVVALRKGGALRGSITIYRKEVRPFSTSQTELLRHFADQAVIAIENTRLFNEVQERTHDLSESLQQQTATSDLLQVISRSAFDLQPIFDAIAERAVTLCGADRAFIYRYDGELLRMTASYNASPAFTEWVAQHPIRPDRQSGSGRAAIERRTVHIQDVRADPEYTFGAKEVEDIRTILGVPILKADELLGVMMIFHLAVRPFTEKQIALVETFADQAAIAIENVRLFNEVQQRTDDLAESLQQQTAVGDVLKTISRSTFDLQPVLDTLVETAARLCDAEMAFILRRDGDVYRAGAAVGFATEFIEFMNSNPITPDRGTITGRTVLARRAVQILDVATDPEYTMSESTTLGSQHTALGVPLLRENEPIGVIVLSRQRVEAFTEKQIDLVTTFADQAVIAIENVRLFDQLQHRTDDLSESLQQQTATSEVLQIISSSPGDLTPVFDKMLENATRVCGAEFGSMLLVEDGGLRQAALYNAPAALATVRSGKVTQYDPLSAPAIAISSRKVVQIDDVRTSAAYLKRANATVQIADLGGARTIVVVPMLRDDEAIGSITVYRQEVRPFSEKQIELLTNFARQAVIAIENARLLRELRQRTDELTEALVYQTGSSNILKVIASSPTDVGPALRAIVESACEICDAPDALVFLRDGGDLVLSAQYGPIPIRMERWPISRAWVVGRTAADKAIQHVHDLLGPEGEDFPEGRQLVRHQGARTVLGVPLLREGEAIGVICLRRTEVQPFNDKQIELLKSFADQAVIAISNVRLFEQVQERTRELTEALVYQTGSSNILKVIASSPTDVGPALQAIVESACEICDANDAVALMKDGDDLRISAHHGTIPVSFEGWRISRQWVTGRAVVDKVTLQVADLLGPEGDEFTESKEILHREGYRTVLSVPLLREGEAIGVICLRRTEVQPFNDKQIGLLKSFADQAVIAISNVRLFEEVQAKTRDLEESLQFQTATSDVLKVISRSPDALRPVLDVIVETSRELCGCDATTIFLLRDERFHVAAISGSLPTHLEYMKANPHSVTEPGSTLSRVYQQKCTLHYPNVMDDPELSQGASGRGGARALLNVPLMSDGEVIGIITLRNSVLRPFTPRQIQAVETFADQAVIAISNVNLFEEVQQRTRELSKSLDDLRNAQDRLIQTEKLASLGQLTAGIAHEIKNPLNFVNNFSALSVELTDELNDILKKAELAEQLRKEIDELTGMLKDNLSRVVQHGKRADSIVKNMLLHSREGTGEHRPADVNALVDESLNLAYHGARAEKPQFNVTLQRDFDPAAGVIEVFPQEITRVLLNLISNGFYAVTKRKADNGAADFEPLVTATTRGDADHVEIRIRDNGTGIPPEVKEKMFNPFFTTKPAGEGTGLGLSMSHDIIVKQHGGTIEVATEYGAYTEFRLVLPRSSRAAKKGSSP